MAQFRGHKSSLSRCTSSPYPYRYHVFLSFRGEDTRKNFTDHLYTALVNAGFHTFRDDPEIERGENIKEKLENAIQQSRSSVIVFSKDYASSRWCLDELVMILERKRTSDHVVFPVYYDIGPSQLTKQAETLSKVPKYQENQSPEKLNGWREALTEVAGLLANVLKNEADGHEAKFIQKIVREIQDKLGRVPLTDVRDVLQKELLDIKRYLDDAEGKQLKFPTVKAWLNDLKEAVYDTEDLLQEIKTELLRRDMEPESGSSTSKVQDVSSSLPSHAFDPALIYPKVKEVLERLDFIKEQRRDVFGMEATVGNTVSQTLQSTSLVEESGVCGRDDEKETLIKLLLSDDKISVIPIVGMGGIGKTTLAQLLYNDDRVEQHFDKKAWASVSEKFDVLQISKKIYESLTLKACDVQYLDPLQSILKAELKGKKVFFVLDDVWNKSYTEWEKLRRPFQFGAPGSKIIVTTRNQDVARMVCTLQAHCLRPLSAEDSWSLFEKHAFKNTGVGPHSHLVKIGRQIVQKCSGLPLAIKSLGGLLCSKLTVGEWESILNSEMWELPQEESGILPSLWLSFQHLPSHLRRCFVYCSIFPKNYEFKTSELVYLWMAEDLLQPTKNKTAEEVGQDYFNGLISRSFFQLSSSFDEYFIMHDLMNDLASFVSGEFCFRWEGSDSPNSLTRTRHISFNPDFHDEAVSREMFEAFQRAKCLHTFLVIKPHYAPSMFLCKGLYETLTKFQCLRMLKLVRYNIQALPDSINNMKHLKHLDLSYSFIKKLPDTICTLYNLQVLLLSNCECLTELPANLGRLISLSHLDITETELIKMPLQMGKLKDLQMLPKFVLDKHTAGDNLPELKKLEKLRGGLCISGLVHSSGLAAYILRDKKFLKELVLDWRGWDVSEEESGWDVSEEEAESDDLVEAKWDSSEEGNNTVEEREVLEKLQPHLNLERLTIESYGGKMFPGWSEYYSSSALVYLKLENCENCISLPPLGQLPSLRELYIEGLRGVVSIGSEFYYGVGNSTTCVNKPFRSLHYLQFYNMSGWKEWSFVGGDNNEGGVFPNLVLLEVSWCPNLTGRLASDSLPSLESLTVDNCPEVECFPEDGFPPKLKSLYIRDYKKVNAKSMQNLNKGLRTLTSLERLSLDFDCDENVDWFAEEQEGLFPSTLTHLEICCLNCETIDGAKWFGHLNSLQRLIISDCSALRCLPDSGLPTSLQRFEIVGCPALQCLPDSGLPTSLQRLGIWGCPALQCLPDSGLPTSLQRLGIWRCPALQCLPDSGLPSSLFDLCIHGCPLLEKRCQRETGEDWAKIAHIRGILIG